MLVRLIAEATTPRSLYLLLGALVSLDRVALETHPKWPRLYQSGVVYRREDPATAEEWLTVGEVLRRKKGDCEDLACWRVAELIVRDRIAARPLLRQVAPGKFHIVVRWPSGWIEDPSKELVALERDQKEG